VSFENTVWGDFATSKFVCPFLQAEPEELPDPRRQGDGGNVAGHAEQLQAEKRHYVADDDHHQEDVSGNRQGVSQTNRQAGMIDPR
jgi:hypothetical protein